MVAEASEVPLSANFAAEAVTQNGRHPLQELPSCRTASQDEEWVIVPALAAERKEEGKGSQEMQSDSSEDRESGIFSLEEESEHEGPSSSQAVSPPMDDQDDRLVMADVKEEEEDDLEMGGQDVEEYSSPRHSGEESQAKKGRGGPGWRKKSQQKMDHAKQWIVDNFLLVTTTVSMVSLSDIEKAYNSACCREGREPLTMYVLARLIHQHFPEAGKCRLGSRGNQKIHYSKLQWRVSSSPNQCHVKAATSTASEKEAEGETLSDNIPSAEIQGKGKKPVSSVSRGKNADEMCHAAREAIAKAALQPLPEDEDEDEEGCEDAAKRLVEVVKWVRSQGKWNVLLQTFAHSASCNRSSCCPLCLMFRRVRRHVVSARHACYVLRIYSVLLKLHVASCNNNNCGMTACPALRASRQMKRGRDTELQEKEGQQKELQHLTKRLSVQANRPNSLRIRLPSPASSLPDSQPSTPSPPITSPHTLPPSPSRIVPLPPLPLRHMDDTLSEHGGA